MKKLLKFESGISFQSDSICVYLKEIFQQMINCKKNFGINNTKKFMGAVKKRNGILICKKVSQKCLKGIIIKMPMNSSFG